ncbi:hypothetical protein [Sinorhizobium alkalisoli]|uniref:hypothetical protein n=1 Tax=Sinorhizobium alkalisoli TaxID=1752398 RepID=UPI00124D1BED|nr:hypothetical protein [Sinorhizobium alkalisoli]MCA1491736.1 hypothetical protein [Ensifer sp. NBAIM29]
MPRPTLSQAEAALDAFAEKLSRIIGHNDIGTNTVDTRIISEAAAGHVGGDVKCTAARPATRV